MRSGKQLIHAVLVLLLVACATSAYYTAAEARARHELALADRTPIDAFLTMVTNNVRDHAKPLVPCAWVPIGTTSEGKYLPEMAAMQDYPNWEEVVRRELGTLGYKIEHIQMHWTDKRCYSFWSGLGYCIDPAHIKLCW